MKNNIEQGKKTAIVAYITIIGTVIAMIMNSENEKRNAFASFHIRQALGIFLSWFLLGYFVSNFDNWGVSSGFYLFIFILWVYGFIGAIQGEEKIIPFLGTFFQKWLKNI
jgi:uncharacterized membrane protein